MSRCGRFAGSKGVRRGHKPRSNRIMKEGAIVRKRATAGSWLSLTRIRPISAALSPVVVWTEKKGKRRCCPNGNWNY